MEALQTQTPPAPPALEAVPRSDLPMAAQQGHPGAFDALVRAYQGQVRRQCLRRGLAEDEAAEVTQDVFMKAYRWLDRYRHQNAFSTWLYRITANTCTDYCRKRARRPASVQWIPLGNDGYEPVAAESGSNPELSLERDQLRAQIAEALDALSPTLREAFVLKEIEGLSYEEIAERTGCLMGTVKSRIFRARRELMVLLADCV